MKQALKALETLEGMRRWAATCTDGEINRWYAGLHPDVQPDNEWVPSLERHSYETTPYWCSAEMTAVLGEAAKSVPRPLWMLPPAPDGFVLFEETIDVEDETGIAGFRWLVGHQGVEQRPCVWVAAFQTWDQVETQVIEGVEHSIEEMRHMARNPPIFPEPFATMQPDSTLGTPAVFSAFFLLCNQKAAVISEQHADRGTRRRFERSGAEPPPPVSVVQLRRPAGASKGNADGSPVDWSHRWIVGGHWSNYWVGPREGERRLEPRWIAPYIKGPDDKPLVTDRVYELLR